MRRHWGRNRRRTKKDSYDIILLPGDGIGPEIMSATTSVLAALQKRCGFELKTTEALIGGRSPSRVLPGGMTQ